MKTNETIANVIASGKNYCQRDSIAAPTACKPCVVIQGLIMNGITLFCDDDVTDLYNLPSVKTMLDEQLVFKFNTIFRYMPLTKGSFAKRSDRMLSGKVAVM